MNNKKKQIWVICDIVDRRFKGENYQILSKANMLAEELEAEVSVVIPTTGLKGELLNYVGGMHLYYDPHLRLKNSMDCSCMLSNLIDRDESICILFPENHFWKEVAVRLACKFNAGLIADCIEIVPDREMQRLIYTRLACSGSKRADIVTKGTNLGICTIKYNVFHENTATTKASAPLSETYIDTEASFSSIGRVIETRLPVKAEPSFFLEGRNVIFGIGQGVDTKKLKKVSEIANRICAGVGFTKPFVDFQNAPRQNQIGQSGKFIACDLYLAFGISGSVHHLCAIQKCKKVVAVNLDMNAPMMQFADISVIADANLIIDNLHHAICLNDK